MEVTTQERELEFSGISFTKLTLSASHAGPGDVGCVNDFVPPRPVVIHTIPDSFACLHENYPLKCQDNL